MSEEKLICTWMVCLLIMDNILFIIASLPIVYYLSTYLFSKFCIDTSVYGIVTSYFTLSNPVCVVLIKVIESLQQAYTLAWTGLVASILVYAKQLMVRVKKDN